MNVLQRNLEAIRAQDPELASRLVAARFSLRQQSSELRERRTGEAQ